MGEIILNVAREVGFKVFQIEDFRKYIVELGNDYFQRELLSSLIRNQKNNTQKKHWWIYCLVEKLMSEGFGTRQSFRIVGEYTHLPATSIHRRYYEKSKEAKDRQLKLDDVSTINRFSNKDLLRALKYIKLRHSPVKK